MKLRLDSIESLEQFFLRYFFTENLILEFFFENGFIATILYSVCWVLVRDTKNANKLLCIEHQWIRWNEDKEYAMLPLYDVISYPVLKRAKKPIFTRRTQWISANLFGISNHPNDSLRNMQFNCVDN